MSSSTLFCPVCSSEISNETGICPSCATPLVTLSSATPTTSPAVSPPHRDEVWPSGARLAKRYRVVVLLGRGGMGEVYRADDLKLGQPVALKFLPRAMEEKADRLERFLDEVRLARRISHPNVCRVYDVGEAEGRHFISMEFIDGENLGSLLRRVGSLSRDKVLELAHQLCRGLAAAHQEGILHRDLKPANLMIDGRGIARITDFGLAALAETITGTEARQGTPAYMAPEQRAGLEVTAKSDLYALGLILYRALSGRPAEPESGEEIAPLSKWVEGIDPAFERAVLRCLAEDPAGRPESAMALASALPLPRVAQAVERLIEDPLSGWHPAPGRSLPGRPNWVIERQLGEGGFGEVWLAEQRKTKELRVFKFCTDPRSLSALQREITLFRLLQETLGEREDIARIYDWNFDQTPYFIEAEYSPGGSLLEWAEEQGGIGAVPLTARLEIAAQVATALSAAHSVGVLHKDVKPGNVLMTRGRQGSVQARLSDFGVGHLTERQRLAEAGITSLGLTGPSLHSARRGAGAGTPLYTAPEVLEGKPPTLQADVYALGVMLYQMVVGDFTRVLAPGWGREIEDDLLREDIAAAVDGSPQHRLSSAGQLADRLCTLEKRRRERERQQRAAREAERVRADLEAARKRRQQLYVLLFLLVFFAAAMAVQSYRVSQAARRANQEAASARKIASFLEELFQSSEPNVRARDNPTVRDLLERGANMISSDADLEPAVEARLLLVMGRSYHRLGDYERASELLEESLRLRRRIFGENRLEVVEPLAILADLRRLQGRLGEAEGAIREAIAIQTAELGRRDVAVASSLELLAHIISRSGALEEAENAYREALGIYRENFGERHIEVGKAMDSLGFSLANSGRFEEAEPLLRQALELKIELDADQGSIAHTMNTLALGLLGQGDLSEAEELAREVVRIREQLFKGRHPYVGTAYATLAWALAESGHLADAEDLLRRAIELQLEFFDGDHEWQATAMTSLAQVLLEQGRVGEARRVIERALDILRTLFSTDHWRTVHARNVLGAVLAAEGRIEEAEPVLRRTREILERERGRDSIYARRARKNVAFFERLRASD